MLATYLLQQCVVCDAYFWRHRGLWWYISAVDQSDTYKIVDQSDAYDLVVFLAGYRTMGVFLAVYRTLVVYFGGR